MPVVQLGMTTTRKGTKMYTVDKYLKDTLLLANSLVIKILDTAIAINNGLISKYDINIPNDLHEWKYFLNISGQKHFTNSDIIIYVQEYDDTRELTLDLLAVNHNLKDRLLKQDRFYTELLLRYPDDVMYINGIIFPVDIDTAINAKDGTVLNYNKTLVYDNELSIIRELIKHLDGFLARWHNCDYIITDELYLTSMLGVMYSTLPNKIMNIRLSKILTSEVHPFHMENFFRSHLDIWDDVQVLTPESRIWLYNNIKYLTHNTGKEEVLKTIISKILTPNKIGIGEYILNKEDPVLVDDYDLNNTNTSIVKKPSSKFVTKKLNNMYMNDINGVFEIEDVVKIEMVNDTTTETDILDNTTKFYTTLIKEKINKENKYLERTKILDIDSVNLFKIYGVDFVEVLIDHWIYNAFSGKYKTKLEFKDENSNMIYSWTPKEAFLVFIKVLTELTGMKNIVISNYNYFSILNTEITKEELRVNLFSDIDNDYLIDTLHSYVPKAEYLNSLLMFKDYMEDTNKFFIMNNLLSSNINNAFLIGTIETVNDRLLMRGTIDIAEGVSDITIDELLYNNNITFNTYLGYDYKSTVYAMLMAFTGMNADLQGSMDKYIGSFINILNKLSSYTTQVIKNIEDSSSMTSKYNSININNTTDGVATVTDALISHALEPNTIDMLGDATTIANVTITTAIFNDVKMNNVDIPIPEQYIGYTDIEPVTYTTGIFNPVYIEPTDIIANDVYGGSIDPRVIPSIINLSMFNNVKIEIL